LPTLPTGTVTFLFTDTGWSTTLLQRLGDRYAHSSQARISISVTAVAARDVTVFHSAIWILATWRLGPLLHLVNLISN
jgi:hypothetical protein